ncbi:PadR family transcriptional regulator [Galbitalea soli]|uniref:PadR family transcriptional regulator n=1 Tax=Galbitalea soli TaxID=1268042 RepID=A0A7C9PLW2_9MICO|nr:PadR family transcriptional regulator [Galbitalea soli]NEM90308.1 PadR family transcriptional regulator [Galbitalea soli]NYJ31016.1 DNA-binding PadR family transcriptional regulator [Galbitalea soli]
MFSEFSHQHPHHHHPGGPDSREFGRGRAGGPGRGFGHGMPGAFGPGFGGFGPRGFMPPGPGRKRRGDIRLAILSLLIDAPSNGYGLIKAIGERSGGTWTPSPGSVYPTLQQLVDEELIEPIGEGKRTDFQLTEQGRAWVAQHSDELARIWEGSAERAEADAGLHESVAGLMGVVHQFRFAATDDQRSKAIAELDRTRRALYAILAE